MQSKLVRGMRVVKGILTAKYIKPVPLFCQWEVTYNCIMRCGFCCVRKHQPKWVPELTTEQAIDCIDQLSDLGTRIINFTGGEPLLRKDLPILINHIKKKKMFLFMNTNGTNLKEYSEKLKDLDLIRVSIDATEKEHDKSRNFKGAFSNAIKGIKATKKLGIKTMINTVVTKNTDFETFVNLTKLAKSLNIQISFSIVNRELQTIKDPQPSDLDKEQNNLIPNSEEFIKNINKLKKMFGSTVATPNSYLRLIKRGGLEKLGCKFMDIAIAIKPDGSMSIPCSGFPANTLKGNLKSAWFSKEATEAREKQGKYWFCNRCLFRCASFPSMLLNNKMLLDLIFSWKKLKE